MTLSALEKSLLAAARENLPSDQAPYAFEKRIMARLSASLAVDPWALWGRSLWRAALSCATIALVCGAWSVASFNLSDSESFSQDLESAVYASVSQQVEDAW